MVRTLIQEREYPRMHLISRLLPPLALGAFLVACGDDPSATRGRGPAGPAEVVVEQAELRHIVDEIEALGTAGANESIEIQPRIASVIDRVEFSEGQTVAAGDVLVRRDDDEEVAGL